MKTICIGDLHGRSVWKLIVNMEQDADRVIFVGDYFDSYDLNTDAQLNNFLDILEFKKSSGKEVVLLLGNHDAHYDSRVGYTGTSGYQQVGRYQIEPVIDANREHLQIAYQLDKYLFSHAGVSQVFMDDIFGKDNWNIDNVAEELNELFRYKPHAFTFNGWDPYGNDDKQTPIWIRPSALMRANKKSELKAKYIQIFGHTETSGINLNHIKKAAGGKYYNIDCLGTSGEYLIIENDKIKVGSIR
jgi:predicted MPP superfamily phosphohydrolase